MTSKTMIAVASLLSLTALGVYFLTAEQPPVQTTLEPSVTEPVAEKPKLKPNKAAQVSDPTERLDVPEKVTKAMSMMERPEMEQVNGMWVRKERYCTPQIIDYSTHYDGVRKPIYSCVPDKPRPVDVYTTYSDEELKEMAYYDPKASYQLTKNIASHNYKLATYYALRASALSGEGRFIGSMVNMKLEPNVIDGVPNIEKLEHHYVMSGVASAIDPSIENHHLYVRDVQRHAPDQIDTAVLDTQINELVEMIESIRSEVGIN